MILSDETQQRYGYLPASLKPKSNRPILYRRNGCKGVTRTSLTKVQTYTVGGNIS